MYNNYDWMNRTINSFFYSLSFVRYETCKISVAACFRGKTEGSLERLIYYNEGPLHHTAPRPNSLTLLQVQGPPLNFNFCHSFHSFHSFFVFSIFFLFFLNFRVPKPSKNDLFFDRRAYYLNCNQKSQFI
jgi:hypothetical protein